MTHFALKILAVILMTADHMGEELTGFPLWLRYIGRLASPVFMFCAAESMVHTHDRKNYLKRLITANAVTVAAFQIVPAFLEVYFGLSVKSTSTNIFNTIFNGALLVYLAEETEGKCRNRHIMLYIAYQLALIIADVLLSGVGNVYNVPILEDWQSILLSLLCCIGAADGGFQAALLIPLFYFCRGDKRKIAVRYALYCAAFFLLTVPQLPIRLFGYLEVRGVPNIVIQIMSVPFGLFHIPTLRWSAAADFTQSLFNVNYQWMMIFALPVILAYNGEKGSCGRNQGRFFTYTIRCIYFCLG
ncbi:MAG: conjugal transfer protein TraX [Oscillospiraceae bacterium]|nr:conjugal transfer protein TraX [Oscillospiraceae bacterium]